MSLTKQLVDGYCLRCSKCGKRKFLRVDNFFENNRMITLPVVEQRELRHQTREENEKYKISNSNFENVLKSIDEQKIMKFYKLRYCAKELNVLERQKIKDE